MKIIADNRAIRKKMIDMDIKSITELSKKSGVSKPKIHQYLKGNSPLSTTFSRLCEYLDLNPAKTVMLIREKSEDNNNV